MDRFGYLSVAAGLALSVAVGAAEVKKEPARDPESPTAVGGHWAYRPVVRPSVPAVKQKAWVKSPIDAFVLQQLEAKGLAPSPDADRATFIRRATLDAWGLIPSPEEVS